MLNLLPVRRVQVADTSMQPALRPGDRLLVSCWSAVALGDVIVFRDPESPKTGIMIKRIVRVSPAGEVHVRGDNVNVSRDSRHFGPVPRANVLGKAVYRYYPATRRGRL